MCGFLQIYICKWRCWHCLKAVGKFKHTLSCEVFIRSKLFTISIYLFDFQSWECLNQCMSHAWDTTNKRHKYPNSTMAKQNTVLNLCKSKSNNMIRTATASNRLLLYSIFAIFWNVVDLHIFEPGETPSNSASHQALNYVHCSNRLKTM